LRTTKKQFEYFKKKVYDFTEAFGLKDWDIYVQHSPCDEGGSIAECSWDSNNRCATIGFNTDYDNKIYDLTEYYLKRYALHEIIHVLLAEIHDLMRVNLVHEEKIKKEVHKVSAIIENAIVD
jgi:hypothetical protein